MLDVLAKALGGGAALLLAVAGGRILLVHEDDNYKWYRWFAGISIWLVVIVAVAVWMAFGLLAFLLIGLVARQVALYLFDQHFKRIEGHPPPDKEATDFLVAVGGVMALLAFLVALAS